MRVITIVFSQRSSETLHYSSRYASKPQARAVSSVGWATDAPDDPSTFRFKSKPLGTLLCRAGLAVGEGELLASAAPLVLGVGEPVGVGDDVGVAEGVGGGGTLGMGPPGMTGTPAGGGP